MEEACATMGVDSTADDVERKMRRTIDALLREGRISRNGAGNNTAIAWGTGRTRVTHRRLHRRRRSWGEVGERGSSPQRQRARVE